MPGQTHVLIIVENLPVPLDYRVWRIAGTLRDAGYLVSVISPATGQYPSGEFEIEGITVLRHALPVEARSLHQYLWEYASALWHEFRLSLRLFRHNRFHVIHACNPPDLIWLIALVWRLRGVRFVFDHHDLCPELLLAKSGCTFPSDLPFIRRMLYGILCLMERISQKSSDAVLATNESYRRIALTRNHCPKEKVFTVRTGPAMTDIPETPATTDPPGVPQIAYVGVMALQDGVDIFLKALHHLKFNLKKSFSAMLIGSGPERENLGRLTVELELDDCVTFTGFLQRDVMMGHLEKSVMGITPDPPGPMNDASTMLKALDYMSCGLPQVMFDLNENRASAGAAALYAEPGNTHDFAEKIAQLLDNGDLRKQLGAIARERITTLTWESCGAPPLLNAYAYALTHLESDAGTRRRGDAGKGS
jgi:glycosyltransferase involved in cell wall biosynthesis